MPTEKKDQQSLLIEGLPIISIGDEPINSAEEEISPRSTPTIPPAGDSDEKIIHELSEKIQVRIRRGIVQKKIPRRQATTQLRALNSLADVMEKEGALNHQVASIILEEVRTVRSMIRDNLHQIVEEAIARTKLSFGSRIDMVNIAQDQHDAQNHEELKDLIEEDIEMIVAKKQRNLTEIYNLLADVHTYEQLCEFAVTYDPILRKIMNTCEAFKARNGDGDYLNRALIMVKRRLRLRLRSSGTLK